MSLVALILLVMVAVLVAGGLHTGPHGLAGSGVVGILASVGLLVALGVAFTRDVTVAAWALAGGTALVSVGALGAGALSLGGARRHGAGSSPSLWGADGTAVSELSPLGTVRVRGETWSAESLSGTVAKGASVHVAEVEGLRLRVWSDQGVPAGAPEEAPAGRREP